MTSATECPGRDGVLAEAARGLSRLGRLDSERTLRTGSIVHERGTAPTPSEASSAADTLQRDEDEDDDRTRALTSLVRSSSQFRLFQSQLRSSRVYTVAGARSVVNDLIDERAEAVRRNRQEEKDMMREIEEQQERRTQLLVDHGDGEGHVKRDLWKILKNARADLVQEAAHVEGKARVKLADEDVDSYIASSASSVLSCGCRCDDDECAHFDATGWGLKAVDGATSAATAGGPKVLRKSLSLPSTHDMPSAKFRKVVRVARGA